MHPFLIQVTVSGVTTRSMNPDRMFRLGMEGNYKLYKNQYSTNSLALNKPQHAEDRDRRRYLAHKFSLSSSERLKWNGTVYGNKQLIVSTLRLTITQLESQIQVNQSRQTSAFQVVMGLFQVIMLLLSIQLRIDSDFSLSA